MPTQVSFTNLFNIKLAHAYFRGGTPKDLSLTPTRATSKLMQSQGILSRQIGAEQKFLIKTDQIEQLKTVHEKRLSFYLNSQDPSFINYTDIPIQFNPFKNQDILYFHNAERPKDLQDGAMVGTQDLSTFGPNQLNIFIKKDEEKPDVNTIFILKSTSENFKIDILNSQTQELLWTEEFTRSEDPDVEEERQFIADGKVVNRIGIQKKQEHFVLNLESLDEGQYTIKVDGKEVKTFCVLHDMARPPLALVNIFIKDLLAHQDAANSVGPTYEVSFDNRATFWRYYFISESSNLTINNVSVNEKVMDSNGDKKKFSIAPIDEELAKTVFRGKTPILLVSEETIMLKEDQEHTFEYTVEATKVQDQSSLNFGGVLPQASPDRIRIDEKSDSSLPILYSEVFVYI
ncbi:MAG: hypothetical protein AB8F95_11320 [Bacteroidia bacterium]